MIYKNRTHASTECELSLLIWIQSAFSPATVPRAWSALPDWLLTCTWTDYHLSFAERKFFFKERCSDFRPPEHSVMLKEAYSNTGAGDSATFLSPLCFFLYHFLSVNLFLIAKGNDERHFFFLLTRRRRQWSFLLFVANKFNVARLSLRQLAQQILQAQWEIMRPPWWFCAYDSCSTI